MASRKGPKPAASAGATSAGGTTDEDAKTKLAAKSNADLDKVTDHVEERELDSATLAQSMSKVMGGTASAAKLKAKELSAVKIKEDDVKLVMREMELDKRLAERALRENGGDLVSTLEDLVTRT